MFYIKLAKCGGMTPARRMIETARNLGLKVMMGCMTESTVGVSAIAQFLPLLDYVDMDGAELIEQKKVPLLDDVHDESAEDIRIVAVMFGAGLDTGVPEPLTVRPYWPSRPSPP